MGNDMEDIILIGSGGHAKSVADCIERQKKYKIIGYTDLEPHESKYSYLGRDDVLEKYFNDGVKNAFICIGYLGKGNLRERLYEQLKTIGFHLPIIVDPSSIVSDTAIVGEGVLIGKGAIINAGSFIGNMCIINSGAIVEHDCRIEDFSHISVGSVLCGGVKIGKSAFIGANATIVQGKKIGNNSVIGAGAIIRKSIGDNYMVWDNKESKIYMHGGIS